MDATGRKHGGKVVTMRPTYTDDVQARLVGLNYDAAAFCAGQQRGVA